MGSTTDAKSDISSFKKLLGRKENYKKRLDFISSPSRGSECYSWVYANDRKVLRIENRTFMKEMAK